MKARPPLPDDIKQLMALVRRGRLFDVQKWIAEGKRAVPPKPYWFSPLRLAVDIGFHSMVEVLLQAGVEQEEKDYMLNRAVWDGNLDLIQLLVDYGADLHSVDFEDACRTGNPEIMRFFLDRGIDAVTHQPFAHALCNPKRPLLGIFMRYREKMPNLKHQVNLALRYHAQEGNLKWVCLLLWAGGDPHVRLQDIGTEPDDETDTSALEEAVRNKHHEIVEKIGIDPKQVGLNRLLEKACSACDGVLIEKLLALGANPNGSDGSYPPMERLIFNLKWEMRPFSESQVHEGLEAILRLADSGGRWKPKEKYEVNGFRRGLYHLEPRLIERLIHKFSEHHVCSLEILLKLTDTPKMKQMLGQRYSKLMQSIESSASDQAH